MKAISTLKSKINNNLSIGIKQMQNILTASSLAASMILTPWGVGTAQAADAVKWHPGHYMVWLADGKYSSSYRQQAYSEIQRTPALRGVVVRYGWGELEKAKGVYDFSNIQKLLDELDAKNKRLVILLELKSSSADARADIAPDYAKTGGIYNGGMYAFESHGSSGAQDGYGIKLWDPEVYERMVALVRALGNRFNSHPNFEAIGFTETAMGQLIQPISSATKDLYYANLLRLNRKTREYFPNTMTFQYTNHPRPILQPYTETFKAIGTALAGPDVFLDDPSLHRTGGLYSYYPKLSGIIPLVTQIEKHNYDCSRFDCTGFKPAIPDLLEFARDNLKVNYIFWVRTPAYFPKVLELLNWSAQKGTPSGGLKSACPNVYPSCVN